MSPPHAPLGPCNAGSAGGPSQGYAGPRKRSRPDGYSGA
eukprot:CAMPEP_0197919212 /NCGR_PEP_ID=MMETSP1439-20131203/86819_1 /TAXON_ID=66791 /ORGANISM="Gonyaulax spinifera, Strain CCMP409" /LENGTH=38 /DNA_ID= /DNA_START= /DNA_END= /DNA_ORIENTATION=